jgi:hypothetical protein
MGDDSKSKTKKRFCTETFIIVINLIQLLQADMSKENKYLKTVLIHCAFIKSVSFFLVFKLLALIQFSQSDFLHHSCLLSQC